MLSKAEKKNNQDPTTPDLYDLNYKLLFLYATELYNEMDRNYQRFA